MKGDDIIVNMLKEALLAASLLQVPSVPLEVNPTCDQGFPGLSVSVNDSRSTERRGLYFENTRTGERTLGMVNDFGGTPTGSFSYEIEGSPIGMNGEPFNVRVGDEVKVDVVALPGNNLRASKSLRMSCP